MPFVEEFNEAAEILSEDLTHSTGLDIKRAGVCWR
jgi:hypothetical protein